MVWLEVSSLPASVDLVVQRQVLRQLPPQAFLGLVDSGALIPRRTAGVIAENRGLGHDW
jgi:hypothetical protein